MGTPTILFKWDVSRPPLAALALLELLDPMVSATIKSVGHEKKETFVKVTQTGDTFVGISILRFLARLSDAGRKTKLYGDDSVSSTRIDAFVSDANEVTVAQLNIHFSNPKQVFLVTDHITIADLAVYSALTSRAAHWDLRLNGNIALNDASPSVARWFSCIENHFSVVKAKAVVCRLLKKSVSEKEKSASGGSFNIPLFGAEMGKVCTRFPPEPSGYLHIGHAKAALLNNYFAREWKGTLILRFDDTNPCKEKQEYVDGIMADLKTLGVAHDRLTHTSDYFADCEKYAVQLLKDGLAYCDNTPVQQLRKERMDGIESKCRGHSVTENLRLFGEMLIGSTEGLRYVLRAKIDMKCNNKCMRDPTLYRCNVETPHHRTGTKYKAYPTYDFACPIVDSLEGVTHCLRTSEYHDRNEQYDWVLNALKIKHKPHISEYSRLSFVNTVLSKRKLQWFVDNKVVESWDDPRFPTVRGLMRRGLSVEVLRSFILLQGASKALTTQEWDKIWTMNRYALDPVAHRYTAIARDSMVEFRFLDDVKSSAVQVPLVPKLPSKGSKTVVRSPVIFVEGEDAKLIQKNEEVTLIAWGNAIVKNIVMSKIDGRIAYIEGVLNLAGSVKSTSKKLTWISGKKDEKDRKEEKNEGGVPCTLVEFYHLLTVKSLSKGQDLKDFVNPTSKLEIAALGEEAMRALKKDDVIQLQRRGFYRVESPFTAQSPMVLYLIPDGKSKLNSMPAQSKLN